ncbi:uncharacterized protein LOC121776796 [Salvia splendens]|uniref:uncharacterized protein LOC121776796 n=1 Tax=Salvia splendens TaxID=180675 RepID=UPI001C26106D|nr:uncharacterized protein LOC121776796 [Salvia splendens]
MESAGGDSAGDSARDITGDKDSRIVGVDTKNLIAQMLLQLSHEGFKRKYRVQLDSNMVRALSFLERPTIRKMVVKLDLSKSAVGRKVKAGELRPHTNDVKPLLTAANKYYLLPDEEEPYRSCKSKRFITKVMFMSDVCRPYFGEDGDVIFDGKIDIFPFTTKVSAQRKSKNRPKGTLETKPIPSVNKAVMRDCLIQKIIPTIKAKWSDNISNDIFIQQDNTRPHIMHNDAEFQSVANTDGFKFHIICQPANSPDCNVLDLGFFIAIQSIQDGKLARGVDDLLGNVQSSFEELSAQTLNKVFLTLQACLTEILKVEGGNGYKTPHINKDRLPRLGIYFHTHWRLKNMLSRLQWHTSNRQKMMLAHHMTSQVSVEL